MLAPLVADKAHRRHNIEHASAKRIRHPLVAILAAKFRIVVVVLRPQAVNDEPIFAIRPALLAAVSSGIAGAKGWRPRQRQDIEIKPGA